MLEAANTEKFRKSVTEKKNIQENLTYKRWIKNKTWICKSYLFFSYKLKVHIVASVKLLRNS